MLAGVGSEPNAGGRLVDQEKAEPAYSFRQPCHLQCPLQAGEDGRVAPACLAYSCSGWKLSELAASSRDTRLGIPTPCVPQTPCSALSTENSTGHEDAPEGFSICAEPSGHSIQRREETGEAK
ncbi:uncharacterized protein LOC121822697 [Peromyscus maniculatus bairdii]|uniref:uncharacterized protein LOC121822697 n=1 Tax=Peromyscus maniculatus bairdii TaxID=230844 RepID=UPI003FCF50A3